MNARLTLVIIGLAAACPADLPPPDGEGEGEEGEGEEGEGEGEEGEGEEGEGEEGEGEPQPSGCITDVTAGDHTFTCGGLDVEARIPAACASPGCGLIVELHGDTGDGLLIDEHLQLKALGEANGYVVIAPTGPPSSFAEGGSTWSADDDDTVFDMVTLFAEVFRVDANKIHVTGFSRGAFVAWRLLCDHADVFASAAPAAAGEGGAFGEATCFEGTTPSRAVPILFLMGRTDVSVGYDTLTDIRDAAIASYAAVGPDVLVDDPDFTHNRWTSAEGAVFETFDHAYETVSNGPWGFARGHCIPGSTMDPFAPQYAVPCELPNDFIWGEQVMQFFLDHPKP